MFRRIPFLLLLALALSNAEAERIKDLAVVSGVRTNQLIGYGLVVGLNGTGDQTTQTPFTVRSLKSMMSNMGVTIPPDINLQLKNVAAVSIHADLPPFIKPGQTIDVTVSSIGNAKSLNGGSLLMTPLKGADGATYAIAQGNLVVGGISAASAGSSVTVNVPSAGRIPNGATVERQVADNFGGNSPIVLNLHQADFTTAERVVEAINKTFGGDVAAAIDASSIQVRGSSRTQPAGQSDCGAGKYRSSAGPERRQSGGQRPHRDRRDWHECAGWAGGGGPRQYDRHHYL